MNNLGPPRDARYTGAFSRGQAARPVARRPVMQQPAAQQPAGVDGGSPRGLLGLLFGGVGQGAMRQPLMEQAERPTIIVPVSATHKMGKNVRTRRPLGGT